MYHKNLTLFNELAEKCGNRYFAARYVASAARQLGIQSRGAVLESKLLTWALTGEPPYDESEMERRRNFDSDVAELEDYLCYVDDKDVAERVRIQYKISLQNRHVTLDTSNVLDKYRQMRVNIILRMMWHGFQI